MSDTANGGGGMGHGLPHDPIFLIDILNFKKIFNARCSVCLLIIIVGPSNQHMERINVEQFSKVFLFMC
jgi:hypothetical protein